jgi:hypothetical protein
MNGMPNFLIIGAQKAGTTALHHYLGQHPQVYMSTAKEPGFFAFEGGLPDFQGPGDAEGHRFVTTSLDEYQKLFQGATNELAVGESSTWYLGHPQAPEKIKKYVPEAKLIAILRNPVDRAYSSYQHLIRDGREPLKDFSKAIDAEQQRIDANWEYLWRYKYMGQYSVHLSRYLKTFAASQLKVFIYEDLSDSPEKLLKDIYQFLELDDSYSPEVFTHLNMSGKRKIQSLDTFLQKENLTKSILKGFLPATIRKQLADYVRRKNTIKEKCPGEAREKLVKFFYEDIANLQDMIDRDLSAWLRVK